jgi:hypothetical protein
MNAPGTLDRQETLKKLCNAIDDQERAAASELELARLALLAGNKLSADNHNGNAARHWHYKAGMVQAAEAIGYTYLDLFGNS